MKLQVVYGFDPDPVGGGFYWPGSPAKRRELLTVKRNHPASYESVYQCRPGKRQGAIFVESDFVSYQAPKNLAQGMADPEVAAFCARFHAVVAAWDTAFEATHESDHTVGIVAGLLPCERYHRDEDPLIYGECEPHLDVYMLDLVREKWQWGDLVKGFRSIHQKWRPVRHVVEKKGSGISLHQSMSAIGIDVLGITTNESKKARAISGTEAGSVQGWFRQHRVHMPDGAEWVPGYKTEMKDFTGDDDSSDDQVDASVHLINHAIQSGGAMAMMSSDWSPETVDENISEQERLPEYSGAYLPPRAELLSWIQLLPEHAADPFSESCLNCENHENYYCLINKRQVVPLDVCEHFSDARAVAV